MIHFLTYGSYADKIINRVILRSLTMANRKIEMYEYRQIIIQMRLGYKDREIARSGLAGRKKCKDIRTIAEFQGWLNPNGKVPTDLELQSTFDKNKCKSPQSTATPYYETISSLVKAGHKSTTIYRHLVSQHRYKGSYTAIQVYILNISSASKFC